MERKFSMSTIIHRTNTVVCYELRPVSCVLCGPQFIQKVPTTGRYKYRLFLLFKSPLRRWILENVTDKYYFRVQSWAKFLLSKPRTLGTPTFCGGTPAPGVYSALPLNNFIIGHNNIIAPRKHSLHKPLTPNCGYENRKNDYFNLMLFAVKVLAQLPPSSLRWASFAWPSGRAALLQKGFGKMFVSQPSA